MNSQKQSASTLAVASTVLPSAEVIALPMAKRSRPARVFTKTTVAKMRCPRNRDEALFWDPSCRGFGLRALASGRRTWIYQYRDEHGRTRRIALGDASAVSLDAARQAARQHAARVVQGANPSAERKSKKDAGVGWRVDKGVLAARREPATHPLICRDEAASTEAR
jgi:Arm domain-containing DNA-binding protein